MIDYLLFYDTETTGFVKFNQPLSHFDQPHIVQLAAALVHPDSYKVVQSINLIVKPDGWDIPDEAVSVHGITTERALDEGMSERKVVGMFLSLWNKRLRIAHNEEFDSTVLCVALNRFFEDAVTLNWRMGDAFCTMKNSTDVCKIPPTAKMISVGRNHFKSPKIEEAYEYFTKLKMQNAHDAMADVLGCIEVYKHLNRASLAVADNA